MYSNQNTLHFGNVLLSLLGRNNKKKGIELQLLHNSVSVQVCADFDICYMSDDNSRTSNFKDISLERCYLPYNFTIIHF